MSVKQKVEFQSSTRQPNGCRPRAAYSEAPEPRCLQSIYLADCLTSARHLFYSCTPRPNLPGQTVCRDEVLDLGTSVFRQHCCIAADCRLGDSVTGFHSGRVHHSTWPFFMAVGFISLSFRAFRIAASAGLLCRKSRQLRARKFGTCNDTFLRRGATNLRPDTTLSRF